MRNFYFGLSLAVKGYARAMGIIRELRLGWVFLVPIAIFVLNIVLGGTSASYLTNLITDWVRENAPFSLGDGWFAGMLRTMSAFFVWLSIFFILMYVGGFVLLILLSPVLAYVSETVDEHITGRKFPFVFSSFVKDIFRGIRVALRNLLVEVGNSILSMVVGLIPMVGFFVPIYLFFLASYFYGFSFMDYTFERRSIGVRQSVLLARKNKGAAIGLGSMYMLLTTIPYIGFALAGFVSIVSVVAGTIAADEIVDGSRK